MEFSRGMDREFNAGKEDQRIANRRLFVKDIFAYRFDFSANDAVFLKR